MWIHQECKNPVSYKAETLTISTLSKTLKKEKNRKLFAEENTLVDKNLSCHCIKLSKSETLLLDDVESAALLPDFAQQLRRGKADFLDNYFTLRDAAGICPNLVHNQNAKNKDGGSWVAFKI